jgi:predicted TIM-barrel fold metal-dependent hydrolase
MAIVDIHCHTFNAEDLPVKGFIYHLKLQEIPVGAALSTVVDFLLQSAAPHYSSDMARINAILGPTPQLERVSAAVQPQPPEEFERQVDEAILALESRDPKAVHQIGVAVAQADAETSGAAAGREGIGDVIAAARRGIRWVTMFGRSRLDQVADLVRTFEDEVDLFTPLLVDLGTGLGDSARTSNRQQMVLYEKMSRLSMLGKLPGVGKAQIHFFAGFDPLRELRARQVDDIETPLELLETAIAKYGFVGVKVYPQMGWRPSGNEPWGPISPAEAKMLDEIVLELAKWCVLNDVPLTAHCSSSNYADQHFEDGSYGSPSQWLPVLEKWPDLHLNLGHFGGARAKEPTDGWPWQIARAMKGSDALFADVGNHRIDNDELLDGYFQMLLAMRDDPSTAVLAERLMYGSDWFMESLHPRADRFLHDYRAAFEEHFADVDLSKAFMGGNALRFLGFDDPNNQNNVRLRARYDRFAPGKAPAWLAKL